MYVCMYIYKKLITNVNKNYTSVCTNYNLLCIQLSAKQIFTVEVISLCRNRQSGVLLISVALRKDSCWSTIDHSAVQTLINDWDDLMFTVTLTFISLS